MKIRVIGIYVLIIFALLIPIQSILNASNNIVYVSFNTTNTYCYYAGDNIYYRIVANTSMVVPPQNMYLIDMLNKYGIKLGNEIGYAASLEFQEMINETLLEKSSGVIVANTTLFDNGVIYLYIYANKSISDKIVNESISNITEEIDKYYNRVYMKYLDKNYSGDINIVVIRVLVPPWKRKEYLDVVRLLQVYVNNNNLQSL